THPQGRWARRSVTLLPTTALTTSITATTATNSLTRSTATTFDQRGSGHERGRRGRPMAFLPVRPDEGGSERASPRTLVSGEGSRRWLPSPFPCPVPGEAPFT